MEEIDCSYCVPNADGRHAVQCRYHTDDGLGPGERLQALGPEGGRLREHFILHYVPHYLYKAEDGNWVRKKRVDMMRSLEELLRAVLKGE